LIGEIFCEVASALIQDLLQHIVDQSRHKLTLREDTVALVLVVTVDTATAVAVMGSMRGFGILLSAIEVLVFLVFIDSLLVDFSG
jgi:hypothetical protein